MVKPGLSRDGYALTCGCSSSPRVSSYIRVDGWWSREHPSGSPNKYPPPPRLYTSFRSPSPSFSLAVGRNARAGERRAGIAVGEPP